MEDFWSLLKFIPLTERRWCHCVNYARHNWDVRAIVSWQGYTHATTKRHVWKDDAHVEMHMSRPFSKWDQVYKESEFQSELLIHHLFIKSLLLWYTLWNNTHKCMDFRELLVFNELINFIYLKKFQKSFSEGPWNLTGMAQCRWISRL